MTRIVSITLFAAALSGTQSGCCCRLPAAILQGAARNQGPPIVFQPPPVVVQPPQPPVIVQPPAPNQPPILQPPGQPNQPQPNQPPVFQPPVFQPPAPPAPPAAPSQYVYSQRTGKLTLDGKEVGTGYSGKAKARNNPAMQNQKDVGPIPIGDYLITAGGRHHDVRINREMIGLLPVAGGNTFNRFPFETFGIIAETNPPGDPPNGALVVVPANVFNTLKTEPLTKFRVVP